ncbi:MAG: hypothetical protein ACRDCB_08250 [Clostridium sp.]
MKFLLYLIIAIPLLIVVLMMFNNYKKLKKGRDNSKKTNLK